MFSGGMFQAWWFELHALISCSTPLLCTPGQSTNFIISLCLTPHLPSSIDPPDHMGQSCQAAGGSELEEFSAVTFDLDPLGAAAGASGLGADARFMTARTMLGEAKCEGIKRDLTFGCAPASIGTQQYVYIFKEHLISFRQRLVNDIGMFKVKYDHFGPRSHVQNMVRFLKEVC